MTKDRDDGKTGSSLFDDDFYVGGRRSARHNIGGNVQREKAFKSDWNTDYGGAYRKPACYSTHPVLEVGGGKLHGGNYQDHAHGCDLYIALEQHGRSPKFDPARATLPCAVTFYVPNMGVPQDPKAFRMLVDTVVEVLAGGGSVHIGCIGGHGRTGMMIAAVVATIGGITDDPITWVRTNYCGKAIESAAQEKYLVKHFDAKPVGVDKRGGRA